MPALEKVEPERAQRALERQLDYMRSVAEEWKGLEEKIVSDIAAKARYVRSALESVKPIRPTDRVLEVGSGGTGIVFGWGGDNVVGSTRSPTISGKFSRGSANHRFRRLRPGARISRSATPALISC